MSIAARSYPAEEGQRTTLTISTQLLTLVDELVAQRKFGSRAAVVDLALRRLAWDLEEARMFEDFADAANDPEWVAETIALAEEAAESGVEAMRAAEAAEKSS